MRRDPSRPLKTWRQTVGEMCGYAISIWAGVLLMALTKPENSILILVGGAISAAIVVGTVKFALVRVPRWRPALRWMFPATWITGP
jgi:hypothetical protein